MFRRSAAKVTDGDISKGPAGTGGYSVSGTQPLSNTMEQQNEGYRMAGWGQEWTLDTIGSREALQGCLDRVTIRCGGWTGWSKPQANVGGYVTSNIKATGIFRRLP
ncbi:uncharacterized protein VDAG_05576 [Verticillium dahliae VdLs.17]|uniref:Uncharacterized protein n=1 Tax=Verticillium dahliae (strain VdLs.17 / ATCC MYA-4575 / FGSC 10137) TaxID=498257 RepID=G2X5S1_VERDV|nr:uncharacterized protein VDAG_05576 [Verticillium dahliae VdLs.17]EGY14412.1 hypothetical protein VDAG_05576 [Verticillium dahliae VdLs.17]